MSQGGSTDEPALSSWQPPKAGRSTAKWRWRFAAAGLIVGILFVLFQWLSWSLNIFNLPSAGYSGPDTDGMKLYQTYERLRLYLDPGMWVQFPAMESGVLTNVFFSMLDPVVNAVIYGWIGLLLGALRQRVGRFFAADT